MQLYPGNMDQYLDDCKRENAERRAAASRFEPITLRMLGDNVTMMRCAWHDLLAELRPDSDLAARIAARLAA